MDLALQAGAVYPSLTYRPRRPEQAVLHTSVRDHYETFRAQTAGRRDGQGLPRFVERAFEDFLTCGCLAAGFARFRCAACRHERLVALALLSGICTFGTFTVVVLAWNGYLLGHGLAAIGRSTPELLPLMLRYVPLEFGAFVLIAAVSHYVTIHLARVLLGRSTRALGASAWATGLAVCLLVLGAWVEAHVTPLVGTALAYTEHADGP